MAKLKEQLLHGTVKDNAGRASTPVGKIDYTLSNMRVTKVSIPSSSFRTAPGVGVTLQAARIFLALRGDWHYKTRGWIRLSDRGSFDIKGYNLRFSVTVKLGTWNGRPKISAEGCTAAAGNLNVKFHGGASWLYNLFSGSIENSLENSFQDMVCKAVRRSIDKQAAGELATFKIRSKVGDNAIINYGLTKNPLFTPGFMDVYLKGEFRSSRGQEDPFCPSPPLPYSTVSKKMVYIWLSDHVLNSAARVYHEDGLLTASIDSYRKNSRRHQLDTHALKYLVVQLYERFPNRPAQIKLYTTQPPVFSSHQKGTNVSFVGNAEILVKRKDGSMFHAFTLKVLISLTLSFRVNEGRFTARASNDRIKLSVRKSFMGDIKTNIRFFNGFVLPMMQEPLLKKINKYGAVGFPLPVVDDIQFVSTQMATGKHFILIETDVKYVPGLSEMRRRKRNKIRILA